MLDNLLDNACKYSEPGTPILVAVEAEGGEVVLSVADRGMGIRPDELSRVFDPSSGRQARWVGKPGVGLGLTVARRLVGMLGGKTRGVERAWAREPVQRAVGVVTEGRETSQAPGPRCRTTGTHSGSETASPGE